VSVDMDVVAFGINMNLNQTPDLPNCSKYAAITHHCNFSQALYKAPWWWIPCDPKHVGAILNTFICFIITLIYLRIIYLRICWIIKCFNCRKYLHVVACYQAGEKSIFSSASSMAYGPQFAVIWCNVCFICFWRLSISIYDVAWCIFGLEIEDSWYCLC